METSQIRSNIDLVNFYWEKDTNRNGKIESTEIASSVISGFDRNSDKMLSPWEVMEAVNSSQPTPIFSQYEISSGHYDFSSVKIEAAGTVSSLPEMNIEYSEGASAESPGEHWMVKVEEEILSVANTSGAPSGCCGYRLNLDSARLIIIPPENEDLDEAGNLLGISRDENPDEYRQRIRAMLQIVREMKNKMPAQNGQLSQVEAYLTEILNSFTEISQIRSIIGLINYYAERDINRNGRLEADEVENVAQNDRNGDNVLSPWEIMIAVNYNQSPPIFPTEEINSMHEMNESGRTFEDMILENDTSLQGMPFNAGTEIRFDESGHIINSQENNEEYETQRGLRLLFHFAMGLGVGSFDFNSLDRDIRYIPPHPNDVGAVTEPISTYGHGYYKLELSLGLTIDFWQYVFLRYQIGYSGISMDEEIHEGSYNHPEGYPPEHRQRYASGEDAYTFFSSPFPIGLSHYLTLGFYPWRKLETANVIQNEDSFAAIASESSLSIESGFAVEKYYLTRGWDRFASIEFMDNKEINTWGIVLGLNYQPIGYFGSRHFLMGANFGLRAVYFPPSSFNITFNFSLPIIGFEVF